MKCGHFAFIIIYGVLSGLYPADSQAKKQSWQTIKPEVIHPNLKLTDYNLGSLDAISNNKLKSSLAASLLTAKAAPRENTQVNTDSPASEIEISRGWSWVAIGVTSGICLFLLWLLFRKPQQLTKSASELEPVLASGDRLSSIEQQREDLSKVKINSTAKNNIAQIATVTTSIGNIATASKSAQDWSEPSHDRVTTTAFGVVAPPQVEPRRKAIWELAKVGDRHSIEPLLKIMPNVEAVDKDLIFETVNQIINRSFEPANQELFANLQHEDPQIRLSAIRHLRQLYQFASPAITKLATMQSDPDYEVRQTAAQALRQLNVNPIPPLNNYSDLEIDRLVSGEESKENLHLVAYLLAELDVKE